MKKEFIRVNISIRKTAPKNPPPRHANAVPLVSEDILYMKKYDSILYCCVHLTSNCIEGGGYAIDLCNQGCQVPNHIGR